MLKYYKIFQCESEMDKLKIYHGSTFVVEEPNLEILNNRTDFGRGFYTTTDKMQAIKWAKIKKNRLKKESLDNIQGYVNIYEYTEIPELNILKFEDATEEWLNFIYKNRQSNDLIHKYDIVIGPVADDNLYQVLLNYEAGVYEIEETIKRLKTYLLSNQISFHTEKSLKSIKYIETIKVGEENE